MAKQRKTKQILCPNEVSLLIDILFLTKTECAISMKEGILSFCNI